MPNWCENDVYVRGPRSEVEKVVAHLKSDNREFDFNKVIPYPEKLRQMDEDANAFSYFNKEVQNLSQEEITVRREAYKKKWGTDKDGFNSGGYEWCHENWDTKWNACDITSRMNKNGSAFYSFSTAWASPTKVFVALSRLFPKVLFRIKWYERGMAVKGEYELIAGKYTHESQGEYHGNRGG